MKALKRLILSLAIPATMIAGGYNYVSAASVNSSQEVISGKPTIKATTGHVEIYIPGEEPLQVTIYALTGQVIKTLTAEPSTITTIELRPGYYIVRCDRHSQQVVVR